MNALFRYSIAGLLAACLSGSCTKKETTTDVTSPTTNGDVSKPVAAEAAPLVRQLIKVAHEDFKGPECMIWDAKRDIYLLTNQNGGPMDASDNGFISKIDPSGNVIASKWIDGASDAITLNSPKGLAIANDMLYVADIDVLRKFDLETGEPRGEVKIEGSTLLNDIGTDGESFYLTDTAFSPKDFSPTKNDAVYKVDKDDAVSVLHKDVALNHPSGIDVLGTDVWVVGAMATEIHKISADGTRQKEGELPNAMLDGLVVLDNDRVLISSWKGSGIYLWQRGQDARLILEDLKKPATFGYDSKREMLLIPLMGENRLELHPLEIQPSSDEEREAQPAP